MNDQSEFSQITERLRGNQALADFLSPLPPLTDSPDGDLLQAVERLADTIRSSGVHARVHLGVQRNDGSEATSRSWSLELGEHTCAVTDERIHGPDLEILATDETWHRLVAGAISPMEAFGMGDMRVLGDLRVARHLIRLLQR
ncbi:SCP2 sterol-binding domain-containing protein [Rhodococcus sp. NCIMB 12038]|uniref:SCP2 sterol-binding domain-containing protein n=1 Tax=Rhodococcus sp. NCIMB 12038 TaxID=933800 RepID=UPI000B3CD1BA|nr:hypothetical protein CA951_03425 [Rhodococcus sp. NCIMB 12038]